MAGQHMEEGVVEEDALLMASGKQREATGPQVPLQDQLK